MIGFPFQIHKNTIYIIVIINDIAAKTQLNKINTGYSILAITGTIIVVDCGSTSFVKFVGHEILL